MLVARWAQVCWAAKAWQWAASCGVLGWLSRWATWSAKDAGPVMWIRSVPSARRAGRSVAATGRPAVDVHADDLVHAHLTLVVDDLARILASPGLRRQPATTPEICSASILDPDGHVVVLEQVVPAPSSSASGQ